MSRRALEWADAGRAILRAECDPRTARALRAHALSIAAEAEAYVEPTAPAPPPAAAAVPTEDENLRIPAIARIIGRSVDKTYELARTPVAAGGLPVTRIGRSVFVRRSSLESWRVAQEHRNR